jgi:tetratricopeptide (TPR) repeat protein
MTTLSFARAGDGDVELSDTVSGKNAPELKVDDIELSTSKIFVDEYSGLFPQRIYNGAKWLKMSPDFVWGCWTIMEGLYKRDWDELEQSIKKMRMYHPNSGVSTAGEALKYQVMMLENFDFRYEKEYDQKYKEAIQELAEAQMMPGNDAWEYFLTGAMMGVDGIHAMRKEEWLRAINRGYNGVVTIAKARERAPEFVDAELGDGLWFYWRSLIAMNIPGIPKYKDQRKEGIQMMLKAEQKSVFLRPAAAHALTYTWIEEGEKKKAIHTAETLRGVYPKNIINLQVLGRAYMYAKKYKKSEEAFQNVLKIDKDNQRVHYYLARLYLRQKRYDDAEKKLKQYLSFDLMPLHEGYAHYFLGRLYQRQRLWEQSEQEFLTAYEIAKIKNAKRRSQYIRKKIDKEKLKKEAENK